jgi:hypothetical protein
MDQCSGYKAEEESMDHVGRTHSISSPMPTAGDGKEGGDGRAEGNIPERNQWQMWWTRYERCSSEWRRASPP